MVSTIIFCFHSTGLFLANVLLLTAEETAEIVWFSLAFLAEAKSFFFANKVLYRFKVRSTDLVIQS